MRPVAFLLCAASFAAGQDGAPLALRVPAIQTQGRATVAAKPDQVRIDIGVITQGRTAQEASAANAKQFTEALAALKKAAGPAADIQTVSYAVQPLYRYPREGGTPAITGYQAVNVVRVRSGAVEKAGVVIDAATATGANTIRGIQFSVKDDRALRSQALKEATADARASAEAIASGLGAKITRVLRVEDIQGAVRPMQEMHMRSTMAADAAGAAAPVESGVIEVEAVVTLTAEIVP